MLRPGDEPIPGYRLENFIGRGQYGQVWRSTAPGGGSAALKFLDLGGKEGWKEFRGIQRVKEIRHAHLMPITAFWLLDDEGNILDEDEVRQLAPTDEALRDTVLPNEIVRPDRQARWLVIAQLLGERTLSDELAACKDRGERGIPIEELLVYMEEAAKGIDFLNSERHDLGNGLFAVQHCDIKPDNMLLVGDSVLVCDYGLAQILSPDGDARTTGIQGSPAYIAPECIERRPSATSDQYSLAVSYFELRTGQLPFEDLTPMGAIDAHRSGNLALAELPTWEATVIQKATAMDPESRYPNCLGMVRALQRSNAEASGQGPAPARRPIVAIAVATIAILAFGLAALLITRPRAPQAITFQIEVTPVEAELTIDGESTPLENGRATLERDPGTDLNLVVSAGPDYEVQSLQVEVGESTAMQPIEIELSRSAIFLARAAEQQHREGLTEAAIASFSQAILKDSRFGRFPKPIKLRTDSGQALGEIRAMALTRTGEYLVAADSKGNITRWRIAAELPTAVPRVIFRHEVAAQNLAVGSGWAVSSDQEGNVAAYPIDHEDQAAAKTFSIDTFADIQLQISNDDRYVLTGNDGQIRRWDLAAADLAKDGVEIGRHDDFIESISLTADDQFVITGSWDGAVKRWPLPEPGAGVEIGLISDDVYVVATNGEDVAFAGAEADRENHVMLGKINGSGARPLPGGHVSPIVALGFDTTGEWIAAGSEDDGYVGVWSRVSNTGQWKRIPLPTQHSDTVNSLAFDRTSKYLLTAGNDGAVILWDLSAKQRRTAVIAQGHAPFLTIAVSSDDRWLLAASADGAVYAWDLRKCFLIKAASDAADRDALPPGAEESGVEA